jgi:phosphoenolpyruvate synthase/pyruvate phosphate dikinase
MKGYMREEETRDSFTVIKNFLSKVDGKIPSKEELIEIAGDLEMVANKVKKIRGLSPAYRNIKLNKDIEKLLELARREDLCECAL